jgi:predicted RNA-binding Zn-ribbon protein involved in translation (DUF1610 family)
MPKLTSDEQKKILELSENGFSSREIAKEIFGDKIKRKSTINDFLYKSKAELTPKKLGARILLVDLETSPILAYVWGRWKQNVYQAQVLQESFILTYSCKWLGEDEILYGYLSPSEVKLENDFRIVNELRDIIDSADMVVGHNACVAKDTPILMQDLTWKKAEDLKKGDKLVSFEEKTKPGTNRRSSEGKWNGKGERKIVPSEVSNMVIEKRHTLKVIFDNGDEVITTDDHYWLGMAENCRNQQWYRTDKLRIGQRVNKFISPWEKDNSYEAGWLSGFISGEGTLKGNGASIDFCQRPTVVLDVALEYCKKLDIKLGSLREKTGGLGKGDTIYTNTLGGKWKTIETLGKLRIDRLINNINWDKFGGLNSNAGNDTTRIIVDIIDNGTTEVSVLETTSSTYIANGYPMHNCNFDFPIINTRCVYHRIAPPSNYRPIDTLRIARNKFRFSSNKLNDICEYLGLGVKEDNGGFGTWVGYLNGEKEAIQKMVTYNIKDTDLLEKLYLRFRPFDNSHPNIQIYQKDINKISCPSCGSEDIQKTDKLFYTNLSAFDAYFCEDCGKRFRGRKNVIKNRENLIVGT